MSEILHRWWSEEQRVEGCEDIKQFFAFELDERSPQFCELRHGISQSFRDDDSSVPPTCS